MIGTPFLIGPDEIAALHKLREMAAAAPVDVAGLVDRLRLPKMRAKHMRQMTAQTVYLPFGYAATFSIETNHPGGHIGRHLSVSSPTKDRVPRPEAVWMVAEALGFTGAEGIENAAANLSPPNCDGVWVEELDQGRAINIVQLMRTGASRA